MRGKGKKEKLGCNNLADMARGVGTDSRHGGATIKWRGGS